MSNDSEARRQRLLAWGRTMRAIRQASKSEAVRKVSESMRRLGKISNEAEAELQREDDRPGQPPPSAANEQSSDDMIREAIRQANRESEERGEPYWPNCKQAAKLVKPRLGIKASLGHIEDIAGEAEFRTKRRGHGDHD
jgi:hypothetical protein